VLVVEAWKSTAAASRVSRRRCVDVEHHECGRRVEFVDILPLELTPQAIELRPVMAFSSRDSVDCDEQRLVVRPARVLHRRVVAKAVGVETVS